MKFTATEMADGVEILAADDFFGVPVCLTGTNVVKAGTPINASGKAATTTEGTGGAANTTDAIGILLYDVDPSVNPNGTIVVIGVIDKAKAEASSGVELDAAAMKAAVPGIVLRDNTGVMETA